ncbi:MAG: hydrogenase small subunit [Pseudomonadota bacterium]
MSLDRREFLKLLSTSAIAVGTTPQWALYAKQALKDLNLPVIWLQGQSCSGCSVSILNTVKPNIAEVLTEVISLKFHQTVMTGTGDVAIKVADDVIKELDGDYVLVVEGSIPVGDTASAATMGMKDGHHRTFESWVKKAAKDAKAILAVGTCAAYGGIPKAKGNETNAKSVSEVVKHKALINIPGCPSHPDWIVGTIAHVLLYGIPALDDESRPKVFFGNTIHEYCERRGFFDDGVFASDFSGAECLFELGCKGPIAHCDTSIRSWNNGVNWCVQAGSPCIGCTEPTFPDHDGEGLYATLDKQETMKIAKKVSKKPVKITV